jgi:hypothetical protein
MSRLDKRPINRQAPCRGELHYRTGLSEFEVQAFLYVSLRRMGYDVRGEVMGHVRHARFNLVVYQPEGRRRLAVRIIEVKRCPRAMKSGTRCHQQAEGYYDRYGVPVDVVGGMKEAREYLNRIPLILPPEPWGDAAATG